MISTIKVKAYFTSSCKQTYSITYIYFSELMKLHVLHCQTIHVPIFFRLKIIFLSSKFCTIVTQHCAIVKSSMNCSSLPYKIYFRGMATQQCHPTVIWQHKIVSRLKVSCIISGYVLCRFSIQGHHKSYNVLLFICIVSAGNKGGLLSLSPLWKITLLFMKDKNRGNGHLKEAPRVSSRQPELWFLRHRGSFH